MSDTNRVSFVYAKESTLGTAPPDGGTNYKTSRVTGEGLMADTGVTTSQELRSDRQIAFVGRTDFKTSGDLNFELSFSSQNDFMQWALQSANWSTDDFLHVTASNSGTDGVGQEWVDVTNVEGAFFSVGDWIAVNNPQVPNKRFYRVMTIVVTTTTRVTFNIGDGDTIQNVVGTGDVYFWKGSYIKNGTTLASAAIRRNYEDLTLTTWFLGNVIDGMNLTIPTTGLITGNFNFMGRAEGAGVTVTTPVAAPTTDVMTSVDNAPKFFMQYSTNGMPVFDFVDASLAAKNNIRARRVVGLLPVKSFGSGTFEMTGALKLYLEDSSVMTHYLAFNSVKMAWMLGTDITNATAPSTAAYIIDLPRVKFTAGKRAAGGINQDILADMTFSAFADTTAGYTTKVWSYDGANVALPYPISATFTNAGTSLQLNFNVDLDPSVTLAGAAITVRNGTNIRTNTGATITTTNDGAGKRRRMTITGWTLGGATGLSNVDLTSFLAGAFGQSTVAGTYACTIV